MLCKKFLTDCNEKWFLHEPEPVQENERCKWLWDFTIQTDKVLEHWRPDIVVIDKGKKECIIIDFAVPEDQNITAKEQERTTKYQNLLIEVEKQWDVKAVVVPIVVGALGTVSKELGKLLKRIDIPLVIPCLQKDALLGTAFILRRVLGISELG